MKIKIKRIIGIFVEFSDKGRIEEFSEGDYVKWIAKPKLASPFSSRGVVTKIILKGRRTPKLAAEIKIKCQKYRNHFSRKRAVVSFERLTHVWNQLYHAKGFK